MQIVIDIPEEMISLIKAKSIECFNVVHYSQVLDAIYNGTIIPKGHGRLIDANNITFSQFFDAGDYAQAMRGIYDAPTIIEADKEND